MLDSLLYCFLQDYSITDKTDLNGNKIGGYELYSGGSVGGYMHTICFNYIVTHYGREKIINALLEKRKYEAFLYSDESKHLWGCTDEMTRLLNEKLKEIAKELKDA